jgi:FecR protein
MRRLSRTTSIASMFLAVILSAPAFAAPSYPANSVAHSALPGTLNYVEGQAKIGSDTLNANSVGSATLGNGQSLETGNGKAEILLTPGVFLRVDSNSALQMISSSITNTEVRLDQGRAMVEVDELHDQNHLRVSENGVETQLVKKGVYEFDADKQQVLVFDGKADVQEGDRAVSVKGGHLVDLAGNGDRKAQGFNKDDYKRSDLYQWSSLRSSYLAEANVDAARVYVANGYYGPGWIGPGWYWASGFGGYTYIPGDGILYSPFGWGFYSPLVVYRAPVFFGPRFFGPRFVGRPVVVNRGVVVRNAPVYRGGFARGGNFAHSGFGGGMHMSGGVHR